MSWQPIETAPDDGTRVLIFSQVWGVETARQEHGDWATQFGNGLGDKFMTHWMPLPEPPK